MKISLKFLETCIKHVLAWAQGFFSGFILIVLNFWSGRKNHIGKKVPMCYNDFAFHVSNHISIYWMPTWVRKTTEKVQAELQAIKWAKECERKAKYWASKKKVNTPDLLKCLHAYTTNESYWKAIARVRHTLSGSPRRKRAVLKHLVFEQIKIKSFFNKEKSVFQSP